MFDNALAPVRAPRVQVMLAAALLIASPVHRAEAQLGKLKGLGAKVAEKAARDAIDNKVGTPAASSDAPAAAKAGTNAYEITSDRLEAVIAALAPMAEQARRMAGGQAAFTAYNTRKAAFDECGRAAAKSATTFNPDNMVKSGAISEQAMAVHQRYLAAEQRAPRSREARFLEDTVGILSMLSQNAMVGASCGAAPYRSAAVIDYQLAMDNAQGEPSYLVPESARGGMTTWQFGRVRERIALWTLMQSGDAKPGEGRFSESEQATLSGRADVLKGYAPFFRDGTIAWVRWSDLKSW
jgi:hypothetical protein